MHIFSSTYFGEISIFGLSKNPATRNWTTLMNPEQFLILVPYLIVVSIVLFFTLVFNFTFKKLFFDTEKMHKNFLP